MKNNKTKKNFIKKLGMLIMTAGLAVSMTAGAATSDRAGMLASHGAADLQNAGGESVYIAAADLEAIANGIDALEGSYRTRYLASLKNVGVYLDDNGDAYRVEQDSNVPPTAAALYTAIETSQTPSEGNDAAADNNLSVGVTGYVNGEYVVGTGQDVQDAYDRGYADGSAGTGGGEGLEVEVVLHDHVDEDGDPIDATQVGGTTATLDIESPGGCFDTEIYHWHIDPDCYGTTKCGNITYRGEEKPKYGHHCGGKSNPCSECGCWWESPNSTYPSGCWHCQCPSGPIWQCDGCNLRFEKGGDHSKRGINCGIGTNRVQGWKVGCGRTHHQTVDEVRILFEDPYNP